MSRVVRIGPNPGPQSTAFASNADITVYGGAAGGGKTWLALLRMGVHADRYPGYSGILFRRKLSDATVVGGLWETSTKIYPMWQAHPNLTMHSWRFKNGSMIQVDGLQQEMHKLNFQGAELAEFCFEEGTHFAESQFWYLFSRLRTPLQETHGFKARCMITCNPDPDSWVRKLIDWYIGEDGFPLRDRACKKRYFVRDGDALVWGDSSADVCEKAPHITCDPHNQPKSLRFIPAKLADNPKGDPTYASRLNALPLVERAQLLGGNWNIRAAAGNVFKRTWYEIIDSVLNNVVRTGRYWDLAATEPNATNRDPDWTRGVKVSLHSSGLFVVHDVVSIRGRPHAVDELIMTTARQDGYDVTQGFWQDPGQAGKSEAERYVRELAGYHVVVYRSSSDKLTYAKPVSSQAEGRNIKLLRGPWNDEYLAEHEAFPEARHDDIVDAGSLAMLDLSGGQVDAGNLLLISTSER